MTIRYTPVDIMTYKESQKEQQILVLEEHPEYFNNDKAGGCFRKKARPFVLRDGRNNLYAPIREAVVGYFKENHISWWGGRRPTGHLLSSQVACLNHLFALRNDKYAVLALVNNLRPGLSFDVVLPLKNDKHPQYVSFEAVSNYDHLNEDPPTRGTNCTSIDALIAARTTSGETWLIPIEWKYTESYNQQDKSKETDRGEIRLGRYSGLIDSSRYLKPMDDYLSTPYFFEPFYQLMRQTLWAEQMIVHKEEEWIRSDRFLHVHVVPGDNKELLLKKYHFSGKGMEESWRDLLQEDVYQLTSPEAFLSPLEGNPDYRDLFSYLRTRYW